MRCTEKEHEEECSECDHRVECLIDFLFISESEKINPILQDLCCVISKSFLKGADLNHILAAVTIALGKLIVDSGMSKDLVDSFLSAGMVVSEELNVGIKEFLDQKLNPRSDININ
jgi:hypothetical protein